MKFIRYLAVIVLSTVFGGVLHYNVEKIACGYGFIRRSGGGFMGTPGDDKSFDFLIAGFLEAV